MENILNKNKIEDRKISIAIMSSFAILTIQYLILIYFNLIGTSMGTNVQIVSKGLVGFFYLLALPVVLRRNKVKFIAIYFISIFIFLLNYLIFSENWIYLKDIIFPFFFTALPSFIYAYSINDWDVLMSVMKSISKVVFVVGLLIGALVFTGYSSVGRYSMSLSYYMLLPAVIYTNELFDQKLFRSGVLSLASLLIILAHGSRGAIMCFGIFIILKFLRQSKTLTYKKVFMYIMLFFIVIAGFVFLNEILEYVYNYLLSLGIRSRSIELFLRDDLYLSGRENLYNDVINQVIHNPFLGLGLAGDRLILGNRYVHNIFIELLVNFGVVLGSIIIVILLYAIIKLLFIKNIERYKVLIIWISIGFIHLMVSSTYLTDFKFWIFLGLIYSATKKSEINNNLSRTKDKNNLFL